MGRSSVAATAAFKNISPYGTMTTDQATKHINKTAPEEMQNEFERQVDLLIRPAKS